MIFEIVCMLYIIYLKTAEAIILKIPVFRSIFHSMMSLRLYKIVNSKSDGHHKKASKQLDKNKIKCHYRNRHLI